MPAAPKSKARPRAPAAHPAHPDGPGGKFVEEQHPRGRGGKFAPRGGSDPGGDGGRTRTREGTPEQRAHLARQIRAARRGLKSRAEHADLAARLRSMRAVRRGLESPTPAPRAMPAPPPPTPPPTPAPTPAVVHNHTHTHVHKAPKAPKAPKPATAAPPPTAAPAHPDLTTRGTPGRAALAGGIRGGLKATAAHPAVRAEFREMVRARRAARLGVPVRAQPAPQAAAPPPAPAAQPQPQPQAAPRVPNVNPKLRTYREHGDHVRAEHDRDIADLAARVGATPAEYRRRVSESLRESVDAGEIYMRVDRATLPRVLDSGRFKNQFETGTSNGALDPDVRKFVEERAVGVPPRSGPAERPVYGYVGARDFKPYPDHPDAGVGDDMLSNYGDVAVRFHPHVRDRATVTVGDSLARFDMVQARPARAVDADAAPVGRGFGWGQVHEDIYHGRGTPEERLGMLGSRFSYVEAQVHGGLHAHDIAEVAFRDAPPADLQQSLKERGIPWRVIPDL